HRSTAGLRSCWCWSSRPPFTATCRVDSTPRGGRRRTRVDTSIVRARSGEAGMIAAHSAASPTKPSDPSTARLRYFPSRVAGKRSPNLAAVIYGTILATAGVASMHESESVTSARALSVLLSTGAVIWAARVYAYLLAERLQGKRRMQPEDVRRVGTREW